MPSSSAYALIAIPNVNRATAFRQTTADALHLEVVLVRDGDEALQEIGRRGRPALLIVDLSLPRVDGFAVVRKLRRQTPDLDTRVIVVAAHEALLAAARELTPSLAISNVLPLSVDERTLREALIAPPSQSLGVGPVGMTISGGVSEPDDLLDRAAGDARRRFQMPIGVGYLRVGDQESIAFHTVVKSPETAITLGEVGDFKFLRSVAEVVDPLVIPQVEDHPVFARQLAKGFRAVRGFAAVSVPTSRDDVRGALAIFDTKPVTLGAAEIDALAAFARGIGQEIDRILSAAAPPALTNGMINGSVSASALDVNVEDVKALQHLASTDPLTGLANRRGGEKHISNEISRAKRERRPLSCILLDIDRFKLVNDTYGHQAGDQLLRDISTLLRRTVRAYDILVRWGGEEFLLVLPGVDIDAARGLAERVRIAVESLDTHGIGAVTISAGVARFETDYDFTATLRTADQRLYQAKSNGRNRVV